MASQDGSKGFPYGTSGKSFKGEKSCSARCLASKTWRADGRSNAFGKKSSKCVQGGEPIRRQRGQNVLNGCSNPSS